MAELAQQNIVKIIWNSKDVTTDVSPFFSALTYKNHEEAMSDELSIIFDNSTGVWANDWYPTQGNTIRVYLGYQDSQIDTGLFQIDEITLNGMPDIVEVKCVAAGATPALRTRNSKAFEAQTLKQIAEFFAKKYGFTVVDTTSLMSQIGMDRKTQEEETDLFFLSKLAKEYGFIFTIRGSQLVFTDYYALDNAASIMAIDKSQCGLYSLTNKTFDTYAGAYVKKRNPKTGKLISFSFENLTGGVVTNQLLVDGRTSTISQASRKSIAGLWDKNRFKESGVLNDIPGDPSLLAGTNFDLTGFGSASGQYHIVSSAHKIQDSLYKMDLEIRKTGTIPKPKRVLAQSNSNISL
jgi:hypothetical protein